MSEYTDKMGISTEAVRFPVVKVSPEDKMALLRIEGKLDEVLKLVRELWETQKKDP